MQNTHQPITPIDLIDTIHDIAYKLEFVHIAIYYRKPESEMSDEERMGFSLIMDQIVAELRGLGNKLQ